MDCPTCGLTNPPEALKCDCGYDFQAKQPSDLPGWKINLAWRQKVAAYWAISWPEQVASLLVPSFLLAFGSPEFVKTHQTLSGAGVIVIYFGIQATLTSRLVNKDYRTFRESS